MAHGRQCPLLKPLLQPRDVAVDRRHNVFPLAVAASQEPVTQVYGPRTTGRNHNHNHNRRHLRLPHHQQRLILIHPVRVVYSYKFPHPEIHQGQVDIHWNPQKEKPPAAGLPHATTRPSLFRAANALPVAESLWTPWAEHRKSCLAWWILIVIVYSEIVSVCYSLSANCKYAKLLSLANISKHILSAGGIFHLWFQ